ncbi:PH domain-containing protein [Barnesiella viscericola]|uniref:PH domain-containing protein n=1 Tax=Barnesiella viscericola TaxID=397865 RepID=A0A921MP70_9BACT|nr:PH domain-containing protein [Barnesiella viscericola]HJG87959.1 PH domain-containing protein [Barnesiella viscericola]
MKTRYRSDVSSGLVTLIVLVLLPCYALMIYLALWIGLALLIIFTALIADTFVNTRYTIDETTLWVQSGLFFRSRYDIDRITEIAKTTSWESAPACSMNRIRLRFAKRQTLILSPQRQQAFIDHLLRINPRISVKPPLSTLTKRV